MTPTNQRMAESALGVIAVYTFVAWVYVALCALVRPATVFAWPQAETFGVVCFALSFVSALGRQLLRARRCASLDADLRGADLRAASQARIALTSAAKGSLVVLLIVAMLFLSYTIGQRSPRPTSAVGRAANSLRVGISFGGLGSMTDDELAEALDDVVNIGARWIRFDMPWRDVQPTSAQAYVWDPFDRIMAQVHRRHLSVLPVLDFTPAWARPADCSNFTCAPANPSEFAAFAGAAAKRYSQNGVHTWEIWNEPNNSIFWQPSPDPVAYTRLLKATSAAIRKADTQAFVVMGGLAPLETAVAAAGDLSIGDFLSQTAESPLRLVDALAVHPYTFPYPASRRGPWESPGKPDSGLPFLRQLLAKSGTPNLPIWITEYGAPTGGSGPAWGESHDSLSTEPDHVTEAQQAALATDAIATAKSEPIIASFFWYTYRDLASPLLLPDGEPAASTENYFGITRVDGSKKPSFTALTDAVKGLSR
jgi:polysaccharide biosynthesis protein PslG